MSAIYSQTLFVHSKDKKKKKFGYEIFGRRRYPTNVLLFPFDFITRFNGTNNKLALVFNIEGSSCVELWVEILGRLDTTLWAFPPSELFIDKSRNR